MAPDVVAPDVDDSSSYATDGRVAGAHQTVDDFLGAMGVMASALAWDCSNCHPGAGFDAVNWVSDKMPTKVIARRMIEMVATINKTNFGGAQKITCWTCHRGQETPATELTMERLYGSPN